MFGFWLGLLEIGFGFCLDDWIFFGFSGLSGFSVFLVCLVFLRMVGFDLKIDWKTHLPVQRNWMFLVFQDIWFFKPFVFRSTF
jgi:hypothetical protein